MRIPAVIDYGPGDNWDGYVAEREALVDWLVARATPNPVVITGDSHANWVRNVPPSHRELDAPPVATEFMGTSISTGGDSAERRPPGSRTTRTTRTSCSATTTAATCAAR